MRSQNKMQVDIRWLTLVYCSHHLYTHISRLLLVNMIYCKYQAWGQVHFKILKYKYKYFIQYLSTKLKFHCIFVVNKSHCGVCTWLDLIKINCSNLLSVRRHTTKATTHHYNKQAYWGKVIVMLADWLPGIIVWKFIVTHVCTSKYCKVLQVLTSISIWT